MDDEFAEEDIFEVTTPDPDNWEPLFQNFEGLFSYFAYPRHMREGQNTAFATVMEHTDTFHRRYLRAHGLNHPIVADPATAYVALGVFEASTGAMIAAVDDLFRKRGNRVTRKELDQTLHAVRQTLAIRLGWMACSHPAALQHVDIWDDGSDLVAEPFGTTVHIEEMPPDPLKGYSLPEEDDE